MIELSRKDALISLCDHAHKSSFEFSHVVYWIQQISLDFPHIVVARCNEQVSLASRQHALILHFVSGHKWQA